MFCRQCGQENDDNNYKCVGCGYLIHSAPVPFESRELVQNYLMFALLSLAFAVLCSLCYCFPVGVPFAIPAIISAAQVNSHAATGNISGARQAAKTARMWCWVSVGASLAGMVLYWGFMLMVMLIGTLDKH